MDTGTGLLPAVLFVLAKEPGNIFFVVAPGRGWNSDKLWVIYLFLTIVY